MHPDFYWIPVPKKGPLPKAELQVGSFQQSFMNKPEHTQPLISMIIEMVLHCILVT